MYTLVSLPEISNNLVHSFDLIPEDKYLKSTFPYRRRTYAAGMVVNGNFYWDDKPQIFEQSEQLNSYVGGVPRKFEALDVNIRQNVCEQVIMNAYKQIPNGDYTVGIHQIRILADTENQGIPTPEGIHQDGFDYVTVSCINTHNLSGGVSVLLDAQDHTKIIYQGTLIPGEQIVFSDKTFAHYTSNISPKIPGVAYRDVIVTTFQKI